MKQEYSKLASHFIIESSKNSWVSSALWNFWFWLLHPKCAVRLSNIFYCQHWYMNNTLALSMSETIFLTRTTKPEYLPVIAFTLLHRCRYQCIHFNQVPFLWYENLQSWKFPLGLYMSLKVCKITVLILQSDGIFAGWSRAVL